MGTHHGGARLDRGDGIDLWGHAMGVRHWLDVGDGIELWGVPWGTRLDRGDGIDLWGRAMGVHDTD